MAIGEAGQLTTSSPTENVPITVNLTQALTDPVIVLTGSNNGSDEFTLRVIGETLDADGNTTSFTFIIEEWQHQDGPHGATETINWIAVEEGTHTLADGRVIQAGTASATDVDTSVTFDSAFQSAPVVVTSVMSNNDATTVDSDPHSITSIGFDVFLEEEQAEDGVHAAETVGWIAIDSGGSSTTGTANVFSGVDENADTLNLGAAFGTPVVVADTQTENGSDPEVVVVDSTTSTTADIHLQEEQSSDSEVGHVDEDVGVVTFEQGLIVTCFLRGTKIETSTGPRPVEDLQTDDLIATSDGEEQPLRLSLNRQLLTDDLSKNPKLYPVRIMAGALGNGLPLTDLWVSRQHRLMVTSPIALRMFSHQEVLLPAIRLTDVPGIFIDEDFETVEYFHLLFDEHQIVFAEGAPAESLFLGPEAMKSFSQDALKEISCIFPDVNVTFPPARTVPHPRQQRTLIKRHLQNDKPFVPGARESTINV